MNTALKLRATGLSYGRISKILSIPDETIRRWCIKFAPEKEDNCMARTKEKDPSRDQQSSAHSDVQSEEVKELQSELKRLREELTKSEIKAEAYAELIKVASPSSGSRYEKKLAPSSKEPARKGPQEIWGQGTLRAV